MRPLQDRYNSGSYGYAGPRFSGSRLVNDVFTPKMSLMIPFRNEERENHVLLVTVINPAYPITCVRDASTCSSPNALFHCLGLIHQICSPHESISSSHFQEECVQAMVWFDCIESAKRARSPPWMWHILSCCTLRIEFARYFTNIDYSIAN